MSLSDVRLPDIGDFTDVPVIEILVKVGDVVGAEDPLMTLESDKATMDIPAPFAGTIHELKVHVGDKVSEGDLLIVMESAQPDGPAPGGEAPAAPAAASEAPAPAPAAAASGADEGPADVTCQVVVLGSGPGGYTAAFRAADLGQDVVLVERYERIGGVCLNVGCIPSKALLHAAKVIAEAEETAQYGIAFGAPTVDIDKLRAWKDQVVGQLTGGLDQLAKRRKVNVVHGEAAFLSPHRLKVGEQVVGFEHAIIACGSSSIMLPGFPADDPRVITSTGALELDGIPERLLVVGGGIIGLEMATVYDALGSKVTVVELLDGLIPGADRDIVKPLATRIGKRYEAIHLGVKVETVEATDAGLKVTFSGEKAPEPSVYNKVLVSVGRKPNGGQIAADKAGVAVDERGFIAVDEQLRTNVSHIFAIGDVVGQPMLAHKASHEAAVAAEVIAGHDVSFDVRSIPSVAYTDPEVAWTGLTETQAKADGIEYEKASFPWAASGRALTVGRSEGVTKLLIHPETRHVLGGGMAGVNAGELIAEVTHAMEMGAVAEDLALTVHPHPTLSETVMFAAEMAEGTITDLYVRKRK